MDRLPESNVFIPMGDGVRLAATLYLPETAGPWPALVEAYPYRKDDVSVWPYDYRRLRDEGDYAVCRVDTRGTGSSDGVVVYEYPPAEAEDMCAVIAWLAEQGWCTGAVGMFGSSYAGFAALHAAMLAPPALRAIVPLYATDDRYTDDIHFNGGIRKAIEFNYPLSMVALNALPPVPALAGDGWRGDWMRRIDELVPWCHAIEEQNGRAVLAPGLASSRLPPDPRPDDGDRRLERPLPERGASADRAPGCPEAPGDGAVEPHEPDRLDPRPADRPRA